MEKHTLPLSKLLEGLEMVSSDCTVYIHKNTYEFIIITDEDLRTYDINQSNKDQTLREWEKDMIRLMNDVLYQNRDDYIKLPDSFEIHEHKIMERFSHTLPDTLRDEFLNAIFRKGAFQRFQQLLIQYGLRDSWFEYKRKIYLDKLIIWGEDKGYSCE
jgi:hypothetical protein